MPKYSPGDSLASYPYLEYFEAKTPQGLLDLISQIKLPSKIVSIYWTGSRHTAWISLSRPIRKQLKDNEQGDNNGSISRT